MRLDLYLVAHYGITRNKAQQLIATDLVLVNAKICNKSSYSIGEDFNVNIIADRRVSWVSRSAEKLAGFIEKLDAISDVSIIPLQYSGGIQSQNGILYIAGSRDDPGKISSKKLIISGANCLDIGSSTGGFSQVLLLHGASHIDAVDVGRDQLHSSLRDDSRLSSYEQVDIRNFAKMQHRNYDIIVCDVSFISLENIIDSIITLSDSHTIIILLYKPQFEVGRVNLRKTGVPKTESIIESKMRGFESILGERDMSILLKTKSTLIGEAGNQEWIYMIQKDPRLI